jgi:hypothetical protein
MNLWNYFSPIEGRSGREREGRAPIFFWVIRASDYPESRSIVLKRLESANILARCAAGEVEDWAGNRIGGARPTSTHHDSRFPGLKWPKIPVEGLA